RVASSARDEPAFLNTLPLIMMSHSGLNTHLVSARDMPEKSPQAIDCKSFYNRKGPRPWGPFPVASGRLLALLRFFHLTLECLELRRRQVAILVRVSRREFRYQLLVGGCLGLRNNAVLVLVEVVEGLLLSFACECDTARECESAYDCYNFLHAVFSLLFRNLFRDCRPIGRSRDMLQGACHRRKKARPQGRSGFP